MIPQTIGRYQIKGKLGAGGMGIVYRAYDPDLLREVALKMLFKGEFRRLSGTKQQQVLARFQQEAKIIASLHHTAIIPVYDFGYQNGEPFIVMPLMGGGGLDDRLEAGTLALDEIVRILDSLAPALDKLHQRHIVHRDLKPSNILFDEENQPYLADFGIARLTEETMRFSKTGTPLGTPAYMSPEQARGDKDIDQRSDIYSLGGMLFKMLTGERPYHRVHPYVLPHFHMNEPPPRLDDDDLSIQLPTEYQTIIDCAMAKKKEERYNSASEMVKVLKAVIEKVSAAELAKSYVEQGLVAYKKGDYDQAIADYDEAIRLNPNDAVAYYNRAEAYQKKKDYDQALANYSQAISLNPDYTVAYHNRGNVYRNKGDYDQAITDYNQAIRLNPNNAEYYNNRGWAYYHKKDYDQAITDYNQAIRLTPNDAVAYYNRAEAYCEKKDYNQAIADYDYAIRLNPNEAKYYKDRANAYYSKKDYDQAIADYDEAIRLNPNYSDAYRYRGEVYREKKEYDQALADHDEAIRLNPNKETHYNSRGYTYVKKRDYDKAFADFDKAIQLNPNYSRAYNNRAYVYDEKGDHDQAIADYKKVLALNNDPELTRIARESLGWKGKMLRWLSGVG